MKSATRKSWDTIVKHYVRLGLDANFPEHIRKQLDTSNTHRWRNEPEGKYVGCEVAAYIHQEIALIERIGKSTRTKKVIEGYFKLAETLHQVIDKVKGFRKEISNHKDIIVNAIDNLKDYIPVNDAIKLFGLSRATYQNYKVLVKNKCEQSYFLWCVKRYPHQLLKKEILKIKYYMAQEEYRYWSKSSVYLIAIRDKAISCGISTWYKYCKLLGYGRRHLRDKESYASLVSHRPNEVWCADVTIYKTTDGLKHYIHFLMDHYSNMILGYSIQKRNSGMTIKTLLQEAFLKHMPADTINFLTDGGSENVNGTVAAYLETPNVNIKHLIAQKDIQFSNSKIESFNKVIKHQFLLPKELLSRKQLEIALEKDIETYNIIRPQYSLSGNTPFESYNGNAHDFSKFSTHFKAQRAHRIADNQKNSCKICLKV